MGVRLLFVAFLIGLATALLPGLSFPANTVASGDSSGSGPGLSESDNEDHWWHHPLSLAMPPLPQPRVEFDPTADYVNELRRFMGLAVSTVKKGNPNVRVTTNFGRFPFDESAVVDGMRLFGRLPPLDVTGLTIYPDYDSSVMNRMPEIISEFRSLKRPVEITEIGVCTSRHTPEQQRILLGVYLDMLQQVPPSSIYVYELQDHNAVSTTVPCESSFGLKDADGTPKPGYQLFLASARKYPHLGVTTRILFSEGTNLDASTFRENVDDLASHGVKNLNLTTEWWKVSTIVEGKLVWDEEKWETVTGAIDYAASRNMVIRLHTSPPWEKGTTVKEYEVAVVEYYERIATLTDIRTIQIYNEANQFRFTDYGPVGRLF